MAFIIIYALMFADLLLVAYHHGQPKAVEYNIWVSLLGTAITLILIWWAAGWRFI